MSDLVGNSDDRFFSTRGSFETSFKNVAILMVLSFHFSDHVCSATRKCLSVFTKLYSQINLFDFICELKTSDSYTKQGILYVYTRTIKA